MNMLTENHMAAFCRSSLSRKCLPAFRYSGSSSACGAACHFMSLCRYYEDIRVSDTYTKWYGAVTKQFVFFIPMNQHYLNRWWVTWMELLELEVVQLQRIQSNWDTFRRSSVGVCSCCECGICSWLNPNPQVSLRIRCISSITHKRIVKATIQFKHFSNPHDVTLLDPVISQ